MQTRRVPKPPRPAKIEGAVGWSAYLREREGLIVALSLLLTSFGLLLTAVTTFLTWKQVAVINEERSTPYRVAIYEERIANSKRISDGMTEFEGTIDCFVKKSVTSECANTIRQEAHKIRGTVSTETRFWPNDTKKAEALYSVAVLQIVQCLNVSKSVDCEDWKRAQILGGVREAGRILLVALAVDLNSPITTEPIQNYERERLEEDRERVMEILRSRTFSRT